MQDDCVLQVVSQASFLHWSLWFVLPGWVPWCKDSPDTATPSATLVCNISPLRNLGCLYTLFHLHSPACEPLDWIQNRGDLWGEERDPEKAPLLRHNIAFLHLEPPQEHRAKSWDWQCLPCLPFVTALHLPGSPSSQCQGDKKEEVGLFCAIWVNTKNSSTLSFTHLLQVLECGLPSWTILWAVLLGHAVFR